MNHVDEIREGQVVALQPAEIDIDLYFAVQTPDQIHFENTLDGLQLVLKIFRHRFQPCKRVRSRKIDRQNRELGKIEFIDCRLFHIGG